MEIARLTVDGLETGRIVDEPPTIAFALASTTPGEALDTAHVRIGDWETTTREQVGIRYGGTLEPYTEYPVRIEATGMSGATATAQTSFRTGRLDRAWVGRWITDAAYETPKQQSPVPMVFRTAFDTTKPVRRAWIEATALGVYELELNGAKVGDEYFAPGFTSYGHRIQVQTYDVTAQLAAGNTLVATVAGGWAVGSFTHKRKNMIYADRQAFLAELHLEYEDGSGDIVATGPEWEVATDGPVRMAEWYDGETFDATVEPDAMTWKRADVTAPRGTPELVAQVGPPVRAQATMAPVSRTVAPSGEVVYDFGQNFAGVVHARLRGRRGQEVVFRHAEVLVDDELFTTSLRTAKATATYTCVDGEQEYSPRLTYMGFRYVGVRGIDPEDLELTALVLHSDLPEVGEFECSDPLLNRLQDAIRWGGRSNFVDVPTDCPQRDEREGWTGDLAVFASTAAFNFDMSRFLDKWLRDVSAEQARGGGIPMVVPKAGNPFPTMATSVWGDVCILAPWAEYLARGDLGSLRRRYPTMRRFLKAAGWWARLFSVRPDRRRVWRFPFQFGDWAAPTGGAKDWLARGKWIGTAYYANSCAIVAQIADLLGEHEDAARYRALREDIARAYRNVFTDGAGRLKDEFQTGYVLPLHFGLVEGAEREAMADHLVRLVDENDGRLSTGFPGTPYILFALSDSGRVDEAFRLLRQTGCPSWLYMIESGGTTIWERWDALRPDGTVNVSELMAGGSDEESGGGMVSFNHYAAGAVGDWLYRRIAGLEPTSGGYRTFRVRPLLGGGLTSARASTRTPYGVASSSWTLDDDRFALRVEVPVSTTATVVLPDGTEHECMSGVHEFACDAPGDLATGAPALSTDRG
ncbi:family 78 glycoside hydrolase catalytic domain [Agromyces mangrovi Wang et al. 2018]|uniref:family 78 glycoside hydrolase catalytic domain n=1 Tax=Agromyces mangrovi TaxID=1858653 RepID=UPI002572490A|nr:family 78 glycoside hydrolase catalytic domain [Agromyces mangrovi]BDZ65420.1 alpha-L-rhamnosidase [Agromyces mangrovi]